jgi:hypothetical protein
VQGLLEAGERLEADLRMPAVAIRARRRTHPAAVDGCPCPRCQVSKPRRAASAAASAGR